MTSLSSGYRSAWVLAVAVTSLGLVWLLLGKRDEPSAVLVDPSSLGSPVASTSETPLRAPAANERPAVPDGAILIRVTFAESGDPAPGARIIVHRKAGNNDVDVLELGTDDRGECRIVAPGSAYVGIEAVHGCAYSGRRPVAVPEGSALPGLLGLPLHRPASIRGSTTGIAGGRVTVQLIPRGVVGPIAGLAARSTMSEADGSFRFDCVLADRSGIEYEVRTDCGGTARVRLGSGDIVKLASIACGEVLTCTVSGRVVTPGRMDMSGQVVEIVQHLQRGRGIGVANGRCDADGYFAIAGVRRRAIEVSINGLCPMQPLLAVVDIAEDCSQVDLGTLEFVPPDQRVHGTVVLEDGSPATGAIVNVDQREAVVDDVGQFELRTCATMAPVLSVKWTDASSRTNFKYQVFRIVPGPAPVHLVLTGRGLLVRLVDSASGLEIPACDMVIVGFHGQENEPRFTMNLAMAGPKVRFQEVDAGPWRFFCTVNGYETSGFEAVLPEDIAHREVVVDVMLRRGF